MKKIVIGVTVLALLLSLGMTVMAAEENDDWFQKNYEFRKDYIEQKLKEGLITEQQAEYMLNRLETAKRYYQNNDDNYRFKERYELQKDYIKTQLEKELITQQQADYMLKRLEERKEYYEENGAYIMPCGRVGFGPLMSTLGSRRFQDQRFGLQSRGRMFKGRGCGSRNRW